MRVVQGYPKESLLDTAVVSLGPVAEVEIAQRVGARAAGEGVDHAALRFALAAWLADLGPLPLGVFNGWLDEARPAGEQLVHHGLLDGARLVAARLEGGDFLLQP